MIIINWFKKLFQSKYIKLDTELECSVISMTVRSPGHQPLTIRYEGLSDLQREAADNLLKLAGKSLKMKVETPKV